MPRATGNGTPTALIVSHPAVLAVNQLPYAALQEMGWSVSLAVPDRWRHEYSPEPFDHQELPELAGAIRGCRVLKAGAVQRHLYLPRISPILRELDPDVVFIEEEPTSIPALQWGRACWAAGVPFGLQMDENLERPYPRVAHAIRSWSHRHTAFIAARSPAAARLARSLGYRGPTPVVPHGVPDWPSHLQPKSADRPFTVGFAGRLIEEKGLWDLVEAMRGISDARLRLIGNGPLADPLREVELPGARIEVITDITHDRMPEAYASLDVLALPSRTTSTWAEQFGRVLVEALWCGVPVVGSSSGEIPWVINTTGGGLIFEEGNVESLRRALQRLKDDPRQRQAFASAGRQAVAETFSVDAAARGLADAMLAARR